MPHELTPAEADDYLRKARKVIEHVSTYTPTSPREHAGTTAHTHLAKAAAHIVNAQHLIQLEEKESNHGLYHQAAAPHPRQAPQTHPAKLILDVVAMNSKQLMQMVEDILGKRVANLTVQQFADITGLSPRTIRQDCASGRLPAFQSAVGTPYLIHYTHLTRYMEVNNAA